MCRARSFDSYVGFPIDPMTGTTDWGLRSMQDDPDSDSWGEQNVFDVYTKSQATALDGTKYKDW
jgi:general secretion pathway protein G